MLTLSKAGIFSTRVFSYKILPLTRNKQARIKIIDKWFEKNITINMSGKSEPVVNQAILFLQEKGFKIAGYNTLEQIIIIENFNSDQQLR